LLVVVMCMVSIVPVVIAQKTPFVINGYVSYTNGTACNEPVVNITNTNTGEITSPDGSQSKVVEHTVDKSEVDDGGIFDFNISLGAMKAQTWYLTPEAKPDDAPTANDGLEHVRDNLMHKGSGTGTGEYFNLSYTEVAWFYADTGAECELGFGDNPWKAHIRTEAIEDDEVGRNLTVEICRLEKGTGDVTVIASHTEQLTAVGSKHLWNITCEDNVSTTQDFSTGDWLAVRLSWDCPSDELQIYYKAEAGSDSYIESPSTDPGYPIPELSTLILFSSGLVILAGYGYVVLKRGSEKERR